MDRRGPLFALAVVAAFLLVVVAELAGGSDGDAVAVNASTSTSTAAVPSTTTSSTGSPATTEPATTVATTTTAVPSVDWTLLVGGDVLMDRSEPAGIDVFGALEPALDAADLAMVNVEMAISDRGTPVEDKEFVFRAPPSAAERIAAAGIDVVSLANNHARDFGPDALIDTVELLTGAGVVPVGAGSDRSAAFAPATVEVGQVRVAVIGVSYIVPGGFGATSERAGVASGRDRSGAQVEAVAAAAAAHDVVLVYVHWGIERDTCPSGAQREQAAELLAAGATAVIGAHPHVLQPIERLDDGLVIWSLGNFVWHPRPGITGETAVVQVDFLGSEITDVAVHPHVLDGDGAPEPVSEGIRHDRIVDITGGDCARHDPGPLPTTTVAPETSAAPATSVAPETTLAPETTTAPTTTLAPETTAAPTPPTTAAPTPPTTAVDEVTGEAVLTPTTESTVTVPEATVAPPEPEITGALPPEDLP
ncbi:MAG: CapA family protein [Actinomycetota bacterium]